MSVLGLDILRAYELSWLGKSGKPEVACMELCLEPTLAKSIDTFALKEYFNRIVGKQYASTQQATDEIEAYINSMINSESSRINFYLPQNFLSQDLTVKSTAHDYFISNNIRFICELTGQPYTGSVLVDFFGANTDRTAVQEKIIQLRNSKEKPQSYAEKLLVDDCVLSLHLARKGGFSWQIVRSHDPEVDLLAYKQRAVVE